MLKHVIFLIFFLASFAASAQQVCYQDEGNLFCRDYTGLPLEGLKKTGKTEAVYATEAFQHLNPKQVRVQALPTTETTMAQVVPNSISLEQKSVSELVSMMHSSSQRTRLEALSAIDRSLYISRLYPRDPYWIPILDYFIMGNVKPNGKLPNEPDIILALDIMARHYSRYNWSGIGGVWPCSDNCGNPIVPCEAYPEVDCGGESIAFTDVPKPEPQPEPAKQPPGPIVIPPPEPETTLPVYRTYKGAAGLSSDGVRLETETFIDQSYATLDPDLSKPTTVPTDAQIKQIDAIQTAINDQKDKENGILDKQVDDEEMIIDDYSCSPSVCRTRLNKNPDWRELRLTSETALGRSGTPMGPRLTAICNLKCIADKERGQTEEDIMQFLSRYVRRRVPFTMPYHEEYQSQPMNHVYADVKASMHVLTGRNRTTGLQKEIDLTSTDLRGINLACRANLSDVNLTRANLEGTDLRDATGFINWNKMYLAAIDVTTRLPAYVRSPFFTAYRNARVPKTPSKNFRVESTDCTYWKAILQP